MKKNFIIKCLVVLGINVSTLFNAATTNAQIDVLDLFTNTGDPIFNCDTSPDVEINVNLVEADPVTTVIIENISGYRVFDDGTCDKKLKFCAPNNFYCTAVASGEFRISFRQNSSNISVNNLSFVIYTNSTGGNLTVTAFRGGTGYPVSPVGNKYTCETAVTPIDYVAITTNSVGGIDTDAELFVMDELFIPSVTGGPYPAIPTVTPSGPLTFCTGESVTLTSSPGISYLWSTGATTSSINVTTGGSYTVTVVPAPRCSGSTSAATVVSVNSISVGGSVTGGTTICAGATSGLLTLSGHTGTITKWQSSNDGSTWTDITNTSTTYTSGILTVTTHFRAVVKSGTCPSVNSSATTVIVNPASVGGLVTGGTTISEGTTSGLLTLSGHIGSVTKWQSSPDGTAWTDIANTSTTYTSEILTFTTQFRAAVKSGVCPTAYSGATTVTVSSIGPGALPEIVCLLDLSWSMNRDFYDHTTSDPNAVKLKLAKNSLAAFVDLLYHNNPDDAALGLVRFPNSPQVNCDAGILDDIQTLDNSYNVALATEIPLLVADGNSTPLLAGIDTAINMLEAPVKKIIVLLTDGRQNCPYTNLPLLIANTKTTLTGAGIKLYTIGFGAPGIVPNDMLFDLASTSGGKHYNIADEPEKVTATAYDPSAPGAWDPATALDAAYSHIIVEGLGLSYISDPLAIIASGTKALYDIPVTALDERICFFVSWVTPQENYLGVKLFTPSGAELSPAQAGILTTRRSNHTIITLTGELLNKPGMTGLWKLEIDGSGIANNSEHYQYSVINTARKLDVKTWFEKDRYFTGDKMKIFLEVLLDGKAITSFDKLSIQGTQPVISLGNWLSSKRVDKNMIEKVKQNQLEEYLKLLSSQPQFKAMNNESKERYLSSQKENFLISIDPVELRVHALMNNYKLRLPERIAIKGLRFTDDGKNGDQKAGDGRYTATFVPKQEGSFILNTSIASTIKEQKVIRETHLQTYVSTRIQVKPVFKKIRLIEKAIKGETVYDITFSLKDRYGNIPMPDAINNLTLSVDKGILAGGITDNMDGTFTQRISLPESINPKNTIMTLSSDGVSRSRKIASNNSTGYLLAGLVLAVITAVSFLRKNKKI
jgi:hypothetical protein